MIYALPGMGADHRIFGDPAWLALPAHFIDWPEYRGETSIAEVAARTIRENGIRPGDSVIGMSLGGIVGSEIANQLDLAALVLISSASNPNEIARILRRIHRLASMVPFAFLRTCCRRFPGLLAAMFADSDPQFIRTMCGAIFRWEGLRSDRKPPFRIHGRSDHVIPPPPRCDLLLDGGHLITVSHAAECVAFIRDRVLSSGF